MVASLEIAQQECNVHHSNIKAPTTQVNSLISEGEQICWSHPPQFQPLSTGAVCLGVSSLSDFSGFQSYSMVDFIYMTDSSL